MFPLLISLLSLRTEDFDIISDNDVRDAWNPVYSQGSPCHPVPSFLEQQAVDSRNFVFTNSGDVPVEVRIEASSADSDVFRPHVSEPYFTLGGGQTKDFTVTYNCLSGGAGWAEMQMKVRSEDKDWDINYTKICDGSQISKADLSLVVLLASAVTIVWLSALLATSSRVRTIVDDETNDLKMRHVCGFLVLGSLFLVLMFFFLVYLEVGLVVMVAFSSFTALLFTLTLLFPESSKTVTLPLIGQMPVSELVLAGVSLGLVILYIITRNWLLNNLIGLSLVLMFLKVLKLTSFKVGASFLLLAFFYDIFWVFYSHLFFGESVMMLTCQ
mmetsp:Transcript_13691/g.25826  ORF Transcript_13691/g.25826 Transcript_13691/m.25826 type:complete len:327 (+) Transcript_13691:2065-3045(+)